MNEVLNKIQTDKKINFIFILENYFNDTKIIRFNLDKLHTHTN